MRKFSKILLIGVGSIFLGLVLLGISVSNGAGRRFSSFDFPFFRNYDEREDWEYENESDIESDRNENELDNESNFESDWNESESDYDSEYFNESYEENNDWDGGDEYMSYSNENLMNYKNEYSGVKSIYIDLDYSKVTVEKGDTFKIRAYNMNKSNFESTVDGDTWEIKNKHSIRKSLFRIDDWSRLKSEVIITVPENYVADRFELNLDAGSAKISELNGNSVRFDVGAGSLVGGELTVDQNGEFVVGAGEIVLNSVNANNVKIDCGVGRVKMTGTVIGKNSIDCGVGEVSLNLEGNQKDYDYIVDCGLGHVKINQDSYSFTSSTKKINDGKKGSFDSDCGVGSINVQLMD